MDSNNFWLILLSSVLSLLCSFAGFKMLFLWVKGYGAQGDKYKFSFIQPNKARRLNKLSLLLRSIGALLAGAVFLVVLIGLLKGTI
jgi:hypothetical protein